MASERGERQEKNGRVGQWTGYLSFFLSTIFPFIFSFFFFFTLSFLFLFYFLTFFLSFSFSLFRFSFLFFCFLLFLFFSLFFFFSNTKDEVGLSVLYFSTNETLWVSDIIRVLCDRERLDSSRPRVRRWSRVGV